MTSVAIGNQASPTSVHALPQPVLHTKESKTIQENPSTSEISATQKVPDTIILGNTVAQRASQFGGLYSALAKSPVVPLTETGTSSLESSSKPSTLPDRSLGTQNLKVNPPAVGPNSSVVPNKLGNIVQISKEYGELHIPSPTSPATPRAGEVPPPNTGGESFGVRTLKKFKSLNSILSRRGSGEADNTPRRTMSGPGRLSKGFRAFKESTVRGLKRLASAGRVRSRADENQ